jgi:hypothetical protein
VVGDGGAGQLDGGLSQSDLGPPVDGARTTGEVSGGSGGVDAAGGPAATDVAGGSAGMGGAGGSTDSAVDVASQAPDGRTDTTGVPPDTSRADDADVAVGPPDVARDLGVPADAPVGTTDTGGGSSTGNAIVDRLAAASAACGPQSRLTVPVGWQMVLAGELGCTFYAPPSWQAIGAGTPSTFAVEDSSRVTGVAVMAGVDSTGTATCTPHGVASWMFANNQDCVGFQELYWQDSVDVVAGVQIPRGDMVYSCTQGGVPIAGYLMVQIHGTWPLCNLLAFAFWMPQTDIETRTCTLTQALNSIQCPQGGTGCDEATCENDCIANGNRTGFCDSEGSCVCSN